MLDKVGDFFTLLVIGAVALHITTNKNSAGTINAVFGGVSEDIKAATAS